MPQSRAAERPPNQSIGRRLAWFAGLWIAGVAALGIVAFAIKLMLGQ